MNRIGIPLDIKLAGDGVSGLLEGYGAAFGNIDAKGDVILPGAFSESLAMRRASGRALPPMYMQHGPIMGADARPVGVWTNMEEDDRGLKVAGRLIGLDTDIGRYNLAQIRDGAMRGLSIGFRVPKGGAIYGSKPGEPRRSLKKIDLGEVSIVDDPANVLAQIDSLKAVGEEIDEINTLSDAEDFLREAGEIRWSKKAARDFVCRLAKIARREAGDGQTNGLLEQIRSTRRLIINP